MQKAFEILNNRNRIIATVILVCLLTLMPFSSAAAEDSQIIDLDDIDSYVQEQMQRSSIPGLSYAIIQNGKIIHMNAFGAANPEGTLMTPQTPLYIGSVGKTFTALAIRQLVNDGRLDLNAAVIDYIPSFMAADPDAARQITIRQLLVHTSGFSTQDGNDPVFYQPDASSEDLVQLLGNFHLNRPVGESYEYSNINYIVLGRVIEVVSGMSYESYVQEYIFNPLDMKNSFSDEEKARMDGLSAGYRYYFGLPVAVDLKEPKGAMAAGFLMSSAQDMAQYLIAFTDHGIYNGISVVNPDGQPRPEDQQLTFNIDWLTQDEAKRPGNTETHSGAWLNYSAGIAFMPAEKIGVVVLANAFPAQWLPVKDAFAITYDVLRLFTGNPPDPATMPLSRLYLLVDAFLLVMAGLVALRFLRLTSWKAKLLENEKNTRIWLPALIIDVLLPLLILLVLPGLILSSSGHINPIWCWNRLIFQIPDVSVAVLILAGALLLAGLIKIGMYVRLFFSRRPDTPL